MATDPPDRPVAESVGESPVTRARRFCAGCGYDLTGVPVLDELGTRRCPECGRQNIGAVPTQIEDEELVARTVAYFKAANLRCKHCRFPLAEATTNACPRCGATYLISRSVSPSSAFGAPPRDTGGRSPALLFLLVMIALVGITSALWLIAAAITNTPVTTPGP